MPTTSPILLARPGTKVFLGLTLPKDDPVVAGTASLVLTGGGQMYNEDWLKGSLFLASNLLYVGAYAGDLIMGQQVFRWSALGVMAALKGWSVWDAMATSQAQRAKAQAVMPRDVSTAEEGRVQPVMAWQWQF